MEGLVRSASEFLAALLNAVGLVGRPRRRSGIVADLDLLDRLRNDQDFGPDSSAHRFLRESVTREVARLAGVELERKKKISWKSFFTFLVIGLPLGYWTYALDRHGFHAISLIPGAAAAIMLLAALGTVVGDAETPKDE